VSPPPPPSPLQLDLVKHISHTSAASGSAWVAVPYTYASRPVDEMLGTYTPPEAMTVEHLLSMPPGALHTAVQQINLVLGLALPTGTGPIAASQPGTVVEWSRLPAPSTWHVPPGTADAMPAQQLRVRCTPSHTRTHAAHPAAQPWTARLNGRASLPSSCWRHLTWMTWRPPPALPAPWATSAAGPGSGRAPGSRWAPACRSLHRARLGNALASSQLQQHTWLAATEVWVATAHLGSTLARRGLGGGGGEQGTVG
jgi:hypothetical protein